MKRTLGLAGVVAAAGFVAAASGQSINVDFSTVSTAPPSTYSAAGLPGVWNSIPQMPSGQYFSLVALNGLAVPVQIYQIGADYFLNTSDPSITGNDALLMNDMIISHNEPTDGCFWFTGLRHGTYEVTMYALTPNDSSLRHRLRVDSGSPGPTMVGGAWPGFHQAGVTYARFTVTTTDGVIGFHSGLPSGFITSGLNGVQARLIGECAADWDHNGVTQPADVALFVNSWFSGLSGGTLLGDYNHDGVVSPADVAAYINDWFAALSSGC